MQKHFAQECRKYIDRSLLEQWQNKSVVIVIENL